MADINRVKYTSEDFATYRQEAEEFYQTYYPDTFNNVLNTDMGNALIDQIAFAMMALTFSINRKASELFLTTARLTSSITKLARTLGYPISSAFPGTTDVTFNLPSGPYPFPITIESGFQIQGPGSIIYEYRQDTPYVIPAGNVSGSFPVKEGVSRRLTFVSNGEKNQSFDIVGIPEGQYLYSDDLFVTVDGVLWSRVSLLKYEDSNIYEVLFTENPSSLRFGDGITGNIPPEGSQIVIDFAYGNGLQGSIGSNQLSDPVNPLVVQGQTIDMTFTNPVGNVGGNPEDIKHVQSFASSFFRTQNAAVIKTDYDTIAQLVNGVAIADAQIMRGVSGDVTIQFNFNQLFAASLAFQQAAVDMLAATVSGVAGLGVSGIPFLYVGGTDQLGVSGDNFLGVSGIDQLGWNGSFVTGVDFLGVSGSNNLGVSNIPSLFVGGTEYLGVSGIDDLGISGRDDIEYLVQSGTQSINTGVSGLTTYLSRIFSDTSKANNVQVVVLGVDANNKYVSPSTQILSDVQTSVQSIADAVVTVTAVDGSSKIISVDMLIELGLSPTAVESDVIQQVNNALIKTTSPYGLLVRRKVGRSLYISDIVDSIRANTNAGDVIFINVLIQSPSSLLDDDGNLIIASQQVVQNNNIEVKVIKRFKRTEVY